MKPGPFINNPRNRQQQGAALLVVMMVLLILTLLGIASLRGGIMQERMAANIATRSMSFQVAEAGLRQAELIARDGTVTRSEEHTSELQSLMRISYAVFCLKKKKTLNETILERTN